MVRNIFERRELNRIMHINQKVARRFKIAYVYRHLRDYGASVANMPHHIPNSIMGKDMELRQKELMYRRKNELRRTLNFGGHIRFQAIENLTKKYLSEFIFKTFLIFNTSK